MMLFLIMDYFISFMYNCASVFVPFLVTLHQRFKIIRLKP